jgi:hypothetical protein
MQHQCTSDRIKAVSFIRKHFKKPILDCVRSNSPFFPFLSCHCEIQELLSQLKTFAHQFSFRPKFFCAHEDKCMFFSILSECPSPHFSELQPGDVFSHDGWHSYYMKLWDIRSKDEDLRTMPIQCIWIANNAKDMGNFFRHFGISSHHFDSHIPSYKQCRMTNGASYLCSFDDLKKFAGIDLPLQFWIAFAFIGSRTDSMLEWILAQRVPRDWFDQLSHFTIPKISFQFSWLTFESVELLVRSQPLSSLIRSLSEFRDDIQFHDKPHIDLFSISELRHGSFMKSSWWLTELQLSCESKQLRSRHQIANRNSISFDLLAKQCEEFRRKSHAKEACLYLLHVPFPAHLVSEILEFFSKEQHNYVVFNPQDSHYLHYAHLSTMTYTPQYSWTPFSHAATVCASPFKATLLSLLCSAPKGCEAVETSSAISKGMKETWANCYQVFTFHIPLITVSKWRPVQ